jgi:hypothetical protein
MAGKQEADDIGSAGVGRTGSFIVVDAILDGLRRERRLPHIGHAPQNQPGLVSANSYESSRPSTSRHSSGAKSDIPLHDVSATIPEQDEEAEPSLSKPMSLSHANISNHNHQRQSFMHHRGHVASGSASSATGDNEADLHSYTSSEKKSLSKMAYEQISEL